MIGVSRSSDHHIIEMDSLAGETSSPTGISREKLVEIFKARVPHSTKQIFEMKADYRHTDCFGLCITCALPLILLPFVTLLSFSFGMKKMAIVSGGIFAISIIATISIPFIPNFRLKKFPLNETLKLYHLKNIIETDNNHGVELASTEESLTSEEIISNLDFLDSQAIKEVAYAEKVGLLSSEEDPSLEDDGDIASQHSYQDKVKVMDSLSYPQILATSIVENGFSEMILSNFKATNNLDKFNYLNGIFSEVSRIRNTTSFNNLLHQCVILNLRELLDSISFPTTEEWRNRFEAIAENSSTMLQSVLGLGHYAYHLNHDYPDVQSQLLKIPRFNDFSSDAPADELLKSDSFRQSKHLRLHNRLLCLDREDSLLKLERSRYINNQAMFR